MSATGVRPSRSSLRTFSLAARAVSGYESRVRAAEIIVRIGGGLGGWLAVFTHALVLAVLPTAPCDPASDETWRGTLLLGVIAGIGAVLIAMGAKWRGSMRWVALIAAPLLVYNISWLVPAMLGTTFGGAGLCTTIASEPSAIAGASGLERIWPIVQLAVVCTAAYECVLQWTASAAGANGDA